MISYRAKSDADPEAAWELMARPARWSSWSPHVRGAWGLGAPEIRPGAVGAVRLLGVVPVPARILDKQPGRSWAWRLGPVEMVHRVRPLGEGCEVAVDVIAPRPLQPLLRATYGPIIALTVRRLAREAERRSADLLVPPVRRRRRASGR